MSLGVDQLDPVVIVWIVAGRNHNAAVKLFRADYVRHTRSRSHIEHVSVGS